MDRALNISLVHMNKTNNTLHLIDVGIRFPWELRCQIKSDVQRFSKVFPSISHCMMTTNMHVVQSLVPHKSQKQKTIWPVQILIKTCDTQSVPCPLYPKVHFHLFSVENLIVKYVVRNVICHNQPDLRLHFTLLYMSWKRLCGGNESKLIVIQQKRSHSYMHVGLLQRLYE